MKIAFSNIAWTPELDDASYALLREAGIAGIEVAPTRIWPEWKDITTSSVQSLRQHLSSNGFEVSSLQSILFQKPDLHLFSEGDRQKKFQNHLCYCADMAAALGASAVVYGAPKSRLRGAISQQDAMHRAVDIFSRIGEYYTATGTSLCIEANPGQYGGDFLTTGAEAMQLVQCVNSPGIRLHLDTACAFLAGEDIAELVQKGENILAHFHASEPLLGNFDKPVTHHSMAAIALRANKYMGWVSIEMRVQPNIVESLAASAYFAIKTYGDIW